MKIDEFGCWQGYDFKSKHIHDSELCEALIAFFKKHKCNTLIDVGCGKGDYVRKFIENNIQAVGFDGNCQTGKFSNNKCKTFDFSNDAGSLGLYDWALSLEVGEHIPEKYEEIFMQNLHKLNKKGVVVSWAVEGQGGLGHFNCRNNDYIKKKFTNMGYINKIKEEEDLRASSTRPWFNNTIMVFQKN